MNYIIVHMNQEFFQGFHSDKKCLACGYWKVYNQCNKAKRIFNLFDRVKEETLDNILDGYRHNILFNNLKDKFESNQKLILNQKHTKNY